MNPYEATAAIESKPLTSKMYRRSRLSFYSCATCTTVLMPMAVIPIARFITQTNRPNMGTWVIPYGLLVLLICFPIGLTAAFCARWMRRCISANPLLPLPIAVGLFALPYVMIPLLRGAQVTFLAQMGMLMITNAVFEEQDSTYVCDMLVRRKGQSILGDFHYVPASLYGGYSNPPNARQVLSFTASKLAALQRFSPKQGLVYNAAYERLPRTVALPVKPSEIKKIRMGIDTVGTDAPTLQLNSHCSICEFRSRCDSAARQEDSLSLLKGLGSKAISKLGRRGIFTVTQYSHTYRARRAHGGSTGAPRQHALQALAVKEQKLYVIGKPELPESPTTVYIDFEGDPERGFVYLIGVLINQNGAKRFTSFWAESATDEALILDEVYKLLDSLGDCSIFTYGSFESSCLKRWSKDERYNLLYELIAPKLTNILSVIYKHLYFPTYTNGLKDIASALGFTWQDASASGIQSIVWRRRWEQSKDFAIQEKLAKYNEDDCVALEIVTTAIRAVCRREVEHLPWAQERVEQQSPHFERPQWETAKFEIGEFDFINGRAHFDYQRDRVYLRVGKQRRSLRTKQKQKLARMSIRCTRNQAIE